MASSDRLRELQRSRVPTSTSRSTHHSQFKKPPHLRAILWVAGSIVLSGSLLGVIQTSSHSEAIAISQNDINSQIMERGVIGSGTVKIHEASVYLGGGLFQIDAMARGETYETLISATSGLKFDPLSNSISIENPDTQISTPVKHGREFGDDVADSLVGAEGWAIAHAVVRTTSNFGSLDALDSWQFPNKAKQVLWGMPIYELEANARSRVRGASVTGVFVAGNAIVLDISKRQLTLFGVLCLIMAVGSAALLLVLRSYPDIARE